MPFSMKDILVDNLGHKKRGVYANKLLDTLLISCDAEGRAFWDSNGRCQIYPNFTQGERLIKAKISRWHQDIWEIRIFLKSV